MTGPGGAEGTGWEASERQIARASGVIARPGGPTLKTVGLCQVSEGPEV